MNGGGRGEAERFWEQRYQERERVWSGRANAVLVEVAGAMPAGTVLDLGCGEGGDAVWLAGLGWRVTAVDVSATALGRAAKEADVAGVADLIDFQQHDLEFGFPQGEFDLVSAQYLQSPVAFDRGRVLRAAADAVAPGGLLLVVSHASAPPGSRHDHDIRFPTPEEELAELDLDLEEWRVERLGAPERRTTRPNGETTTVADNVVAVRRLER